MNEHFISVGKFTWTSIGLVCSALVLVFVGHSLATYMIGDSLEGQIATVLTQLLGIGFVAAVIVPFALCLLVYFGPNGPKVGIHACLDWMVSGIAMGLLQWVIGAALVFIVEYTISPEAGMIVFVTYYYATSMFIRFNVAKPPTEIG